LLALSSGQAGHRTVPPALIADIASGSYPAVMNILLALRRRDAKGEGAFIDVSMMESVFPFMYWAIGAGLGAGAWPEDGGDRITGGSPRYHLYERRGGKVAVIAALEQKFLESFTAAIGLAPEFIDDECNPRATMGRVTEIIAGKTAAEWEPIFD
jgi:alpha-methylacyl-CoA racemase